MAENAGNAQNQVQQAVTEELRSYWQTCYQAYQAERPAPPKTQLMQTQAQIANNPAVLPSAVLEAYNFYREHLEAQDRGSVTISQNQMAGDPVYVVMGQTDGDDGWIELYDQNGTALGFGRTYIELVSWTDQDTLRQQVENGEYPDSLDQSQTLWGT